MSRPTVLSFDIDKTLVDPSYSLHAPAPALRDVLRLLAADRAYLPVLNTGRDLASLQAFDRALGIELPGIFLSGRGFRINGAVASASDAVLPEQLIARALELLQRGIVPYLDIKDSRGVTQVIQARMPSSLPFGIQKSEGWYQEFSPELCTLTTIPQTLKTLFERRPLRLEVPIDIGHAGLAADQQRRLQQVRELLQTPANFYLRLMRTRSAAAVVREQMVVAQVLTPLLHHNKGTGLKGLLERLDAVPADVVHFGDSDREHNSDTIVSHALPEAEVVTIVTHPHEQAGQVQLSALAEYLRRRYLTA